MTKSLGIFITSILLLLCLAVAFPFWSLHRREAAYARKAHQDLLREVRLARAEGIPLDRSRWKTAYPPPAEDAGPVYDDIALELKRYRVSDKSLNGVNSTTAHYPPTASDVSQAKSTLKQHAQLLALIHTALGRKQGVLRLDWNAKDPSAMDYPQLNAMRPSARLLLAESMVMAHEGRVQEAIQNQALGFRISDHCASGKTWLFALVGYSANAITLQGMRKLLYQYGENPAVAKSVLEAVHNNEHTPDLIGGMRMDAAMQYWSNEYLRTRPPSEVMPTPPTSGDGRWSVPHLPQSKAQQNAYQDDTEAALLHHARMNIIASARPFPEAKQISLSNEKEWNRLLETRIELAEKSNSSDVELFSVGWKDKAATSIVEISARLLIWKSQHGAFPETLSAIGETPLDPFAEKPFGYRREGAGFVLYSVGEDGNFDGGSANVKPKGNSPMFRYPIPAYYRLSAKPIVSNGVQQR
ncbi:MAG: hypothetical protein JWQ02_1853 [Capsulimonas sp.]|nr:hypothetical protein [Capsulimonas sp.]